jgi:hypothetical protein
LADLGSINFSDNKLNAIHPKTFSHLSANSLFLLLAGNPCINKNFIAAPVDVIEQALAVCGANYPDDLL